MDEAEHTRYINRYTSLAVSKTLAALQVFLYKEILVPDAYWQTFDGGVTWQVGSLDIYASEERYPAYRADVLQEWLLAKGTDYSCMRLQTQQEDPKKRRVYYSVHYHDNGYDLSVPAPTQCDAYGLVVATVLGFQQPRPEE